MRRAAPILMCLCLAELAARPVHGRQFPDIAVTSEFAVSERDSLGKIELVFADARATPTERRAVLNMLMQMTARRGAGAALASPDGECVVRARVFVVSAGRL